MRLRQLHMRQPAFWQGIKLFVCFQVESNHLKAFRKSLNISALPNENHDFHITVGVWRTKQPIFYRPPIYLLEQHPVNNELSEQIVMTKILIHRLNNIQGFPEVHPPSNSTLEVFLGNDETSEFKRLCAYRYSESEPTIEGLIYEQHVLQRFYVFHCCQITRTETHMCNFSEKSIHVF